MSSRRDYKPSGFIPLSEQAERKKARQRQLKAKKKARQLAEMQRKKQELIENEMKRANDLSNQRWSDCLRCLAESVPQLKANPWLIILERLFIHDYLDSLTEILSNLSKHENDIDSVRRILQEVYEAFVEIGRFAKYQPAFSITDPGTLKRFVRLLDQVAHRGSDKALFPNVLSLLGPTFEREELYPLLAEAKIVHSLMSFVRTDWMPTPSTLALLLAIIEQLSLSSALRALFMEDSGFERLQGLAYGTIEGFTKDQQLSAQQALALFPPPRRSEEMKENDPAASAAPNNNLGSSPSPTPNNTTGNEINNNSSYTNNDNQNTQQQYSSNNYQTTNNNNNNNNGTSPSATPSIQSNNNNNNNNNVSVNQPIPPSSASSHMSETGDDGIGVSEDHSGGMDGTEDHDNDITNTEDDASP